MAYINHTPLAGIAVAAALGLVQPAFAQTRGEGGTGVTEDTELPTCERRLGTVALVEEAQPDPGAELSPSMAALLRLAQSQEGGGADRVDPLPLIRLMINSSGCFQVVERGAASAALARERELAGLTNQIATADYLLTAQVVYQDRNARRSGGGIGGLLGGVSGLALRSRTSEAQVVLTLTNVETGVQEIIANGSARQRDRGLVGGGLFTSIGIGALGGGYTSTDIGKVTSVAMLDAFIDMIAEAKVKIAVEPEPEATQPMSVTTDAGAGELAQTLQNDKKSASKADASGEGAAAEEAGGGEGTTSSGGSFER